MRSEFETGLAWQSQHEWTIQFDDYSEDAIVVTTLIWPELSHIDPPACTALSAQADDQGDDEGTPANASTMSPCRHAAPHYDRDCHV